MAYSSHRVNYQLNKNDALYIKGYSNNSGYATSTISDVVEMKKGDRVFVKHRLTSSAEKILGDHHSTFSGYFMQE
jgi:predicted NUDIX family phosphoesterase